MAEWLSYSAQIDGAPAYADFDASLDDDIYRGAHAQAVSLTVSGFGVDAQRLPTDAADDALYALEEKIEAILASGDGSLAVTYAWDGKYRYVAYARDDSPGQEFVAAARAGGYEAQLDTQSDPKWQIYARWALSGEELEAARDRAQLEELASVDADLSSERDIYFDFEFASSEHADKADDALTDSDYAVAERDLEDDDGGNVVQVTVAILPTIDAIGDTRRKLTAIVTPFGGTYLGWGCDPDA